MSDFRSEFYAKTAKTQQRVLPPPRKKVSDKDPGHAFKPKPKLGLGMRDSPELKASLGALPFYQSPQHLQHAVNMYFDQLTYLDGETTRSRPPTIAGLTLALGFKSPKALKSYEEKGDEYSHVVETARTRIEEWKNTMLLETKGSSTGVIFDLKNNHGWAEKSQTTQTVDTGDSLSRLLLALQGNILRPTIEGKSMDDEIEDGEFTEGDGEDFEDEEPEEYSEDHTTLETETLEEFFADDDWAIAEGLVPAPKAPLTQTPDDEDFI